MTIADTSKWLTKEQLEVRIEGEVITPSDANYDQARMAWNLSVDQYPSMIVIAKSANDVVEAVRFARAADLDIAVQGGAHGTLRPANSALMIVTSQMRDIQIDVEKQTARVQAGLKWGMVLEAAQKVGLAPLLGSSPDVGIVGYTLGGGMGWLARKYGLSTDNVNYFELVTAEGKLIRASKAENPELFWAMRGGGGAFGIVVSMEIRLFPVTEVYAGNLYYPAAQAKEVMTRYRDWVKDVPEELTSSISVMNFPPIPDVPEFLRGQSFVIVRGAYTGDIVEGENLMRYWREWQAPVIDDFKALPFINAALISNDPIDPMPGHSSGAWLRELTDEAIDTLIQYGLNHENAPSPFIFVEVRHAGGAISKVSRDEAAYSHRDAQHVLQFVGITPTPEAVEAFQKSAADFKGALAPVATGGVYMNFLEGDEGRAKTRNGFSPDHYERLMSLKTMFDPDNVFSYAFDIKPAPKGEGEQAKAKPTMHR